MLRRMLLLLGCAMLNLSSATMITSTARWDDVEVPESCLFIDTLSRSGRIACYGYTGSGTTLWTAMLTRSQGYRWVLVTRDGQSPLTGGETLGTLRQPGRLACTDEVCYFTSSVGSQVSVWKATDLLGQITFTRLLQSGPGINLQQVGLILDVGRLFVYAEVQGTKGLYEVLGVQNLRLAAAESGSGTFEWGPNLMFVKGEDFVFKGTTRVINILGKPEDLSGFWHLELGKQAPAKKIVLEHSDKVDGASVINARLLAAGARGFLLGHDTYNAQTRENKSFLFFWDPREGLTRIAESISRISETYVPGVRPVGGVSWGLAPYVITTFPEGARRDELWFWNPESKLSIRVTQTGESIYPGSSLDTIRLGGGTTANNSVVVSANVKAGSSSSIRFVVGIRPIPTSLAPQVARPGDMITVKGSNLFLDGMTTRAMVGPFEAPVIRVGDDATFQLPASVPTGPQPVTLELKDNTGTIQAAAGTVEVINNYPLPAFTTAGVVNAASFQAGPVAPGEIVSLFGNNLALQALGASALPLPNLLANTRVLIDGQPSPLFYVSPGQINFQVPHTAVPRRNVTVQIETRAGDGATLFSQSVSVSVAVTAPGCFRVAGKTIVTKDFNLVTTANPARISDAVSLWCNGLGAVSPAVTAGEAAPVEPLARTTLPVTITIGGVQAEVLFAGLAPGFAGLYQVNLLVPALPVAGVQEIPGRLAAGPGSTNFSLVIAGDER